MRWQGNSARTVTGGRLKQNRGKKKYEIGREAGDTTVSETRKKSIETFGGNLKYRLLRCDVVCLNDPVTGNAKKAKIESVIANDANLNYIRRNIITKGAIIKTEFGEARVTNRPSQDGAVNAVLLGKQ